MYKTCHPGGHASRYGHHRNAAHAHSRRRPKYNVPVNIEEKESHYEVAVYATGFNKENIQLNVSDDNLFIRGTRTLEEGANPVFLKQEFPVRSFERVLFLNGRIDTANITARHENSVLIVILPKITGSRDKGQEIRID